MLSCVVWDMNGTLINDVAAAVSSVNDTLAKCDLPPTDCDEYRRNMDMPITLYYSKHFDLTQVTFDFLSREYHAGYERYRSLITRGKGAIEAVRELHARGVRQCVVSGFEQKKLLELLEEFGFLPYLDGVCGAPDDTCESKIERGCRWLREQGVDPRTALVVGDLVHDRELARALGADCMLFSGGHQDKERLQDCGAVVIDDLREVLDYEEKRER